MVLTLEAFDTGDLNAAAPPRPNADYLKGFAEGEAAAQRLTSEEQSALKAELVQAVADMAFGFDEAFAHIMGNLDPLLKTVLAKLLPATLDRSLISQLHERVMAAAQKDALDPVVIQVNEARVASVKDALNDLKHPHLQIKGDPLMSGHAALVNISGKETCFDLDSALAEITEVFGAVPQAQNGSL